MSLQTKILIHDARPDVPEFLLNMILTHGYKAGYAKDSSDMLAMLLNDQYDVVLANGGYRRLEPDLHRQLKSAPVFIIDISDSHTENSDTHLQADLYLRRPILISELWQAIKTPS